MVMLPRDLADLQAHYQSLVEGVSAGALSYDDAVQALANIAATDAAGVVWRLDISGNFLSGPAGMEPVLTDPQRFVERTSPGPWDAAVPLSAGGPMNAPSFATGSFGPGAFGSDAGGFDPTYGNGYNTSPYGAPAPTQPGSPVETERTDRAGRRGLRLPAIPDFNGGFVESVKRYRTLIIVASAVVGAALIWSTSSTSTPTTQLDIPTSTATPSATPISDPAATPTTVAPNPLLDTTNALLAQLGTGTPVAAPAVVANPGQGDRALLRRAQFAGYTAVGLTLRAVSVTETGEGKATAKVELVNPEGVALIEGSVELVQKEAGWLLKSWPVLG